MDLLEPTPAGSAAAAALVVAGAPLFSAGLRVLRLRRRLRQLTERPLAEAPSGFVMVRGRVAIDSPLVGPLSGKPCAGFALEIHGAARAGARVEERRAFRLSEGGVVAQVLAEDGVWEVAPTAERAFARAESLSQNLAALFRRSGEAWWIARRGSFTVTERALLAGQECWVIVSSRAGDPSTPTFAVIRPSSRTSSTAMSSGQCGRCQRSIACSRAAFVLVPRRNGKNADFGKGAPGCTSGGTITASTISWYAPTMLSVKSKAVIAKMLLP